MVLSLNQYAVAFATDGKSGSSLSGTTPQTINHGASASAVTANHPMGFHFVNWTGSGFTTTTANPLTVTTVTQPLSLTSNFAIDTFLITASAGTGGSITASQTVDYGGSAMFSITPSSGYRIAEVVVDGVSQGVTSSYTFTNVTATHTIAATFDGTVANFSVSTNGDANGTITPAYLSVLPGACLTVIITPDRGYKLGALTLDGVAENIASNPVELPLLNILAHHLVNATFTKKTYTLTPSAGSNGSISPATAQTASYGDSVTFTITPSAGYTILDVRVDGISMGAVGTLTLPKLMADHTVTALFH